MEATSSYWKPVFYLLEAHGLDPWLVNARDVKHLPGRPKSDVIDAVWLCKLAERQMLRPSFVPPWPIRRLRDLTRYRVDLVAARTAEKNRVEKLLEDACIKLSVVASDIFGVSGRAMMAALIAGESSWTSASGTCTVGSTSKWRARAGWRDGTRIRASRATEPLDQLFAQDSAEKAAAAEDQQVRHGGSVVEKARRGERAREREPDVLQQPATEGPCRQPVPLPKPARSSARGAASAPRRVFRAPRRSRPRCVSTFLT